MARSALRPVGQLTNAVQHVADTEDLEPIPTADRGELSGLTASFNQMLSRLARSRTQQNRLIADASHELRTPLTSMRTNVELLALDARRPKLSEANRLRILDDVHAQTVEFSALIADLMHLSRDTTPRTDRQPVELRGVVEKALERVRRRGHDLTFTRELDSLIVSGDPAGLTQAVTNLLDNAVKWSPPGGTIHLRLSGHQLSVSDDGPGIAEADLPHVFDRFYRAETARSTPGTGLGLAITAKTVHDHGGTITAGPSPTGGAHVTITLPGAPRTSTAGDPASDRTADPASAGSSGTHRSQPSRDPASTAPTTPTGPTLESVVAGAGQADSGHSRAARKRMKHQSCRVEDMTGT